MGNLSIRTWITPAPPTVGPKENLKQARAKMRAANVAELLVVDDGKLVGTLSERDIWEHCPTSTLLMDDKQANELLEQFRVGGVMALHPPVIRPEASLSEVAKVFAECDRSGLPVVEDGKPIGFLTEASVMHAVAMLLGQESAQTKTKES
jgi:acetoin utilization protein AcuB